MGTLTLYVRTPQPATNALRARLNALAAAHGYTATRGPTAGQGNLAELLRAIDAGEVALVLLPEQNRASAIRWLREQAQQLGAEANDFSTLGLAEALETFADALSDAADRAAER